MKMDLSSTSKQALIVAILGGFCFGIFSSAFNIAVKNPLPKMMERYDSKTVDETGESIASLGYTNQKVPCMLHQFRTQT